MSNEPDQVNSGAVATAIALVALATMAIALVVEALVRNTTAEVLVTKDQTQENAFRHLKSEQVGSLTEAPVWRDRSAGLVSVPVDRAMEMVLTDIRENPYAMSPGYKPPAEEKPKCAEGESCLPCAEGETCGEGACPAGQKCLVPAVCPPGQTCPELTQAAPVPTTPDDMSATGSPSHARGVSPAAPVDAGASPSASPQPETVPALTGPAEGAP